MIVSGGKVFAIDKVWHDETLSGDGQTKDSKLGVVGGGKGLVTSGAISAKEGCFGLSRNGWVSVPTTADFHNVWTKVEQIETSAKVWNTIPSFNKTDDKVYGLSKNGWREISGASITTVYKFQGSCTVAELPTNAANGDVWDIKDSGIINEGTDYEAKVQKGDNVAWVVATNDGDVSHWDKLAASVSLEGYATEAWVSGTAIPSALSTATSGNVRNLWTEITSYVDDATEGLVTSADTWNATSETVAKGAPVWCDAAETVNASASYWNTAYESVSGATKTSDDMEIEGKLAETQAITSWVDSKIEGLSEDYFEKKDIEVSGETLIINNL